MKNMVSIQLFSLMKLQLQSGWILTLVSDRITPHIVRTFDFVLVCQKALLITEPSYIVARLVMQAVRKYVNPVGYQELADRPRDRWLNVYE